MVLRNQLVLNFSNDERFLGITKTYFNDFINKISIKPPINIAHGQTSYVINTQSPVAEQPVTTGLFPYANYVSTEQHFNFPTRINFKQTNLDVNVRTQEPPPYYGCQDCNYGCQDCSLDYY
jgi:hypothetical protein